MNTFILVQGAKKPQAINKEMKVKKALTVFIIPMINSLESNPRR